MRETAGDVASAATLLRITPPTIYRAIKMDDRLMFWRNQVRGKKGLRVPDVEMTEAQALKAERRLSVKLDKDNKKIAQEDWLGVLRSFGVHWGSADAQRLTTYMTSGKIKGLPAFTIARGMVMQDLITTTAQADAVNKRVAEMDAKIAAGEKVDPDEEETLRRYATVLFNDKIKLVQAAERHVMIYLKLTEVEMKNAGNNGQGGPKMVLKTKPDDVVEGEFNDKEPVRNPPPPGEYRPPEPPSAEPPSP